MGTPQIKAFQFENLEKLTRQQVELHQGVLRYLPDALPSEVFLERLVGQLEKYMRAPVEIELTALRELPFKKYLRTIPDPTTLVVIACLPLEQKAFLQVDYALTHIMVDRMLGGPGEYPQDLRAVSPIEEGVLKFLALKTLNILAAAGVGGEIQFRFEALHKNSEEILDLQDDKELMALLSFQVTIGKKAGFIRLALPHPMVHGILAKLAPQERPLTAEDLRRLERVVDVKLPIWIELGHIEIGAPEISRLETGDVVLLDEVFVELGETGVSGSVTVRVNDGVGGGFRGQVVHSTQDKIEVEIQESF